MKKQILLISIVTDNAGEYEEEFLKEAEMMKILPKHPKVVPLLGCCTIQGILIFSLIDHFLNKAKRIPFLSSPV